MKSSTADKLLVCCSIAAIPATGYAVFDFFSMLHQIKNGLAQIYFDTGTGYFLLSSIFFPMLAIQKAASKNKNSKLYKQMDRIVILWFIGCLGLANLWPFYLTRAFEKAGYIECHDPRAITHVTKSQSLIYVMGDCGSIKNIYDSTKK